MCGFFGSNKPLTLDRPELVLCHRGPDNFGKIKYNDWMMFHNRLSIIDLQDRSNQPYIYENLICLYNGEIFNFIEIKKELSTLGYTFTTKSDTEVVVKAYHKWGKECLKKFNGMFAFIVLDKSDDKITIIRDRFGIKPLYYHVSGNNIYFGSEIKSLFAMGVKKIINKQYIADYIANGQYSHNDLTIYEDINEVLPGYMLEYKNGKINHSKWYMLPVNTLEMNFFEATHQFNYLLDRSIELRTKADVPISLSLSGGLDSSSIFYRIFKNKLDSNVSHVYHWTSMDDNDESEYAQEVASLFEQRLTKVKFSKDCFYKYIDKSLTNIEQPFGGLNTAISLKTFECMNKIKNRIIFSGDGADEILGGYSYHAEAYISNSMDYHYQKVQSADGLYRESVLDDQLIEMVSKTQHIRYFDNPLKDSMYNDLIGSKLRRSLAHQDLNSMSCSVEMRHPFLDHHLVEFCYSLNSYHKCITSTS